MKKSLLSLLLLLAMLGTLLPMALGSFAAEPNADGGDTDGTPLTYEDLYVKDGLSVLLLAFDPTRDGVTLNADGSGTWENRVTGKPLTSATLNGGIKNAAGVYSLPFAAATGNERVVKTSTAITSGADGEPLYKTTTCVYATGDALTDAEIAAAKAIPNGTRYHIVGDDGNTYEAQRTETTVEGYNGSDFSVDHEVLLGGWQTGEGAGIGYDLPDFYTYAGISAHSIKMGDELTTLPDGEYTIEIVANIGMGVGDSDNDPYTLSTGFIHEGDGAWTTSFAMGPFRFFSRNSSKIGPQGTGSISYGFISYAATNQDGNANYRFHGSLRFSGYSQMTLRFEKRAEGAEYNYVTEKDSSVLSSALTGSYVNVGNQTVHYISNDDSSVREFVLLRNAPATVYAIRVYDRALTQDEKNQNHFADLAAYYEFDLSLLSALNDSGRVALYDKMTMLSLGGDKAEAEDAYTSSVDSISYVPGFNKYDELYVKDGLTLLLTAYGGKDDKSVSLMSGAGTWYDKVQNPDGSFSKYTVTGAVERTDYTDESGAAQSSLSGWKYTEGGGIGYDMTLKQSFKLGDTHYIEIDKSEVPEGEYTLQIVMSSAGLVLEGDEATVKKPYFPPDKVNEYWHERWGYLLRFGNYSIYSKQHICNKDYGTATLDQLQTTYGKGEWNLGQGHSIHKPIYNAALSGTGVFHLNLYRTYPDAENTEITINFLRDALTSEIKSSASGVNVVGENGTIRLMQATPGTVYAIRIYDRKLTEEELIQNHFADLCAYYKLDISLFTTYVPEASRPAVYRQWAKYTFDSHTKEDLQRQLDESISATFVKFDGFSVKTEGKDNELAAIFTVNEAKIREYLALNYTIEYGVLLAKENAVGTINDLVYGSLKDGVYSEKLWASDGSGAQKFLSESDSAKTFGYSVFFDQYTIPAELAAKYVCRAYIRLVTPEGNVILAYMNASTMDTGSSVSFYDVVKLLNTHVEKYAENRKFIDIIENIYTPHDIYVNTVSGSDQNDGKSAATAFKTVEAATAAAKLLVNTGVPVDVKIHLPAGTTYLNERIELSGDDITASVYKIRFVGDSEGTTISGTTPIGGSQFAAYKDGIYVYELPEHLKGAEFRTLYANGKMATLAHNDWFLTKIDEYAFPDPETGELYWVIYVEPEALKGLIETVVDPATGEESYRLIDENAELSMDWSCVLKFYYANLRVVSIDWEHSDTVLSGAYDRTLTKVNKNVEGYIGLRLHLDDGDNFRQNHTSIGPLSDPGGHSAKNGFDYMLSNNLAFLDEPGEYYYDQEAGLLYYMPEKGVSMSSVTFDVPLCEELFLLDGFDNAYFENLTFTGLTSNFTTHYGHMSGQAGQLREVVAELPEALWVDDAAIVARDLCGLTVKNCSFLELPYYGIYLGGVIEDVTVTGCNFDQLGSSAISAPTTVYGVRVEDNYLHNIAEGYYNAVALFFMHAKDLKVLRNSIVNCAYSAVSVGWTWKWHDGDPDNLNFMNVEVAYNYIENALYFTFDGGAVYFNGGSATIKDPYLNSSIHHNYHYNLTREGHTIPGNAEVGSKNTSWYLDGSCSHVYVYDNVVWVNEDEEFTSKYSYISIQGGDGWTYNPANFDLGSQSYRIVCENNYFLNLYQDYFTTGYGRIKDLFHLAEFNSILLTKLDPYSLSEEWQELYNSGGTNRWGEPVREYMLIDPEAFEWVMSNFEVANGLNSIVTGAGCTASSDRPLARADEIDLSEYLYKSVTNYKDAENDLTMDDVPFSEEENVYSKK